MLWFRRLLSWCLLASAVLLAVVLLAGAISFARDGERGALAPLITPGLSGG